MVAVLLVTLNGKIWSCAFAKAMKAAKDVQMTSPVRSCCCGFGAIKVMLK